MRISAEIARVPKLADFEQIAWAIAHGFEGEIESSSTRTAITNEWETGSESANAKALGVVWRDGTSANAMQNCRKTTIVAVCAARYTAIVLPRHFCSSSLESSPSCGIGWFGPSFPLVLVMANCRHL